MLSWNNWPSESTVQQTLNWIIEYVRLQIVVKRDIQDSDEEAVRVKEQSILELGGLLAKTGQAAGKSASGERLPSPKPNEILGGFWRMRLLMSDQCKVMACPRVR